MAEDQERAERIKELKAARPGLTWQAIADHVGVSMRGAQAWAETGEIAHENAKQLAELFGVDWRFIERGPTPGAPSLMDVLGAPEVRDQLDRIERMLIEVRDRLGGADGEPRAKEMTRGLEAVARQARLQDGAA